MIDIHNWKRFDISEIEPGKEYIFFFPNKLADYTQYYFGRIDRDFGKLEFDVLDYTEEYDDEYAPTHYLEITPPQEAHD